MWAGVRLRDWECYDYTEEVAFESWGHALGALVV
jgi:hypothetical protein